MTTLTFSLKKSLDYVVNCAALTPNNLAGKTLAEIAAISLVYGKKQLRLDEMFDITQDKTTETTDDDVPNVIVKHSTHKLDYLGAHMRAGQMHIEGDAGTYLGFNLTQGEIHCHGNSLAFAACNMRGGLLSIHGNTGDFLGGASSGQRKGMRGGTVLVKGNAGERTGDQMRRGLILIEGNSGDYCASRMIAGTIGVLGNVGRYVGFNMKRGTLLLTKPAQLHATIQDCGMHTLPFLSLMYQSFAAFDTKFASLTSQRVQRFVGDAACSGNGEILLIAA
jgi:formylmethanofuran dehydrogenase subunit C